MLARVRTALTVGDLLASARRPEPGTVQQFEAVFTERFDFQYGLAFPYGRRALRAPLGGLG